MDAVSKMPRDAWIKHFTPQTGKIWGSVSFVTFHTNLVSRLLFEICSDFKDVFFRFFRTNLVYSGGDVSHFIVPRVLHFPAIEVHHSCKNNAMHPCHACVHLDNMERKFISTDNLKILKTRSVINEWKRRANERLPLQPWTNSVGKCAMRKKMKSYP